MAKGLWFVSSSALLTVLVAALAAVAFASSCGGSVDTTSSSGGAACSGAQVQCADGCGSDYFPAGADCKDGAWVCPAGTVDPADCPAGTCWGAALPCETCGENGWSCSADVACVGTCGGIVCAECPANQPGEAMIGGCLCSCAANGTYTCAPSPDCCTKDIDCGDKKLTPCVNGVCKEPVMDACWSDVECPPGMVCQGAAVCGCGFACVLPDIPGMCVPG